MSEFFATNTPDPHHWTVNSDFGAFFPFGCICNHFATNPLYPHHWTLNSCLVHFFPFGCIWDRFAIARICAKLVQLIQKFVPRCLVRIFTTNASDPYHWTLISCFGAFLSIWVHLEPFHYCTKMSQTGAINAKVRVVMSY